MILSPGILALIAASSLLTVYSLYAAGAGLHILAGWDAGNPSEAQLRRERKTSLLSSLLGIIMVFELLCLVLFVTLVDRLHGFFTGAMCAAGTLSANSYGNPTLLTMLAGFYLCILWLVVNHLDSRASNFPLIRWKYWWLVLVALVLGAQTFLLVNFFLRLNPNLITSCCARFFSENGVGLGSDLAHLSPGLMQPVFWVTLAATIGVGLFSMRAGAWDGIYAILSGIMLPVGVAAVISFISVRIYELPTHHCPFCLLHGEYGFVGYPLYTGLLLGTVLGMGIGLARWLGHRAALLNIALRTARRLRIWSLAGYALLGVMAVLPLLLSDFRLRMESALMTGNDYLVMLSINCRANHSRNLSELLTEHYSNPHKGVHLQ